MQDYSSASDGNDLFAGIIRNASGANRTTNAVKFFVRVLTDPIPINADHAKQVLNAGFIEPNFEIKEEKGFGLKKNQAIRASENPQNVRLMFRGRIVKSNNGLRPHIFIRDPCKISITRDRAFAYKLIAKHTLFISKKSFFGTTPKLGDLVEVTLERSDFKGPNLQVAFFDEIVDQQQSEIYNFEKRKECTSLKQIMDRADFGDGGAVAPGASVSAVRAAGSSISSPKYTPCNESKTKTVIDAVEFAKILKDEGVVDSIGISILAIALIEQPQKNQTAIGGFNHNHFGIMGDSNWGAAGRAYIKCAVSSTEGSGGTGDRTTKYRWFAAFNSEADAAKFMISKIKDRKDVDENGNEIKFSTVNDGETWAKLHTLRWLSPSDKRERIKNTELMKKKGKTWDKAKEFYDKA